MTFPRVIGIDPATSRVGIAPPDGDPYTLIATALDPIRRLAELRDLLGIAIRRAAPIDVVALEGYSYGSPTPTTTVRLGEAGGIIRLCLHDAGIDTIIIIPPATLKLFATGHGNAKKPAVIAAAIAAGANPTIGPDAADAWHLRAIGRAAVGITTPTTDHERRAIASVTVREG